MLQPLARKGGAPGATPVSRAYSTPAPVGGWNARDGVFGMKESDARILRNWFPDNSRIRIRRGFEEHGTGLTGAVESLMTYASPTAQKMFAAADGSVYDVSTSGAVGDAALSDQSNDRWQYVNMGTSGGNFLVMVNGEDAPQNFDGSDWSTTPAITGVTAADLVHVTVFKRRLLFTIKDSLKFAYLDVESIGGAASTFDVSPVCQLGGYLMAIDTWTRDGGDGLDDLAVLYTSRGEVLLYQGTDPGDSSSWSLIGRFVVGAPIGRRCMVRSGADLILLSQDGFLPLSTTLSRGRVNAANAISDKIRDAVNSAARDYGDNFGWQGVLYPKGKMLLFNIPAVENTEVYQYVANTNTGSWCEFRGMNANCFALFNEDLYFGGDGAVYKADSGFDDNGVNIEADVLQAPTYLGSRGGLKAFRRARPILTTDGTLKVAMAVNVDYDETETLTAPTFTAPSGATWDVSAWDETQWAVGATIAKDWTSVLGVGNCGAIRMKIAVKEFEVSWSATDWLYEPGGLM
jgi:hypothetical protein